MYTPMDEDRVLLALKSQDKPLTFYELMEHANMGGWDIAQLTKRLCKDGRIKRVENGTTKRYRLA